jgi:hypothetical protein
MYLAERGVERRPHHRPGHIVEKAVGADFKRYYVMLPLDFKAKYGPHGGLTFVPALRTALKSCLPKKAEAAFRMASIFRRCGQKYSLFL